MYKLEECVGRSKEGFSEAVKEVVNQAVASGKKVHFFEVIEQRGLVKDNKLDEFQVIVKIATVS